MRLDIEQVVVQSWTGRPGETGETLRLDVQSASLEREGVARVLLQPVRDEARPAEAVDAIVHYESGRAETAPPPQPAPPSAPPAESANATDARAVTADAEAEPVRPREATDRPAGTTPPAPLDQAERAPEVRDTGRPVPDAVPAEVRLALNPREAAARFADRGAGDPVPLPIEVDGGTLRLTLPDGTVAAAEIPEESLPEIPPGAESGTEAALRLAAAVAEFEASASAPGDARAVLDVDGARIRVRIELPLPPALRPSGEGAAQAGAGTSVRSSAPDSATPAPPGEPSVAGRRVRIDAALEMGVGELVELGRLARRGGVPDVIDAEIAPRAGAPGAAVLRVDGQGIPLDLPESLPLLGAVPATIDLPNEIVFRGRIRPGEAGTPASSSEAAPSGDALLRAAGVTPTAPARDAARALREQGTAVTRDNVETLTRLAADAPEAERPSVLRAAAHLLSEDLPPVGPLVRGLAGALREPHGVSEALSRAGASLEAAAGELPPEAADARAAVVEAARTVRTAGLAPADASRAEGEGRADAPWLRTLGSETVLEARRQVEAAAEAVLENHPALARIDAALSVLLDADPAAGAGPAAAPLPPMAGLPAAGAQAAGGRGLPVDPATTPLAPDGPGSGVPAWGDAAETPEATATRVATLVRRALGAATPEDAAGEAARLAEEGDRSLLRLAAQEFQRAERETIAREGSLTRLAEAAAHLRDAGERISAYKAETVHGQRSDPGMLVAEVPVRMGEDAAGGRMQMYFRANRARQGDDAWNARIVLDLNTTRLGPVAGDLRVHGREVGLTLFTESPEAAEWLSAEAGALQEAIATCGFRCAPEFRVDPRQAAAPAVTLAEPEVPLVAGGTGLDIRA